MDDNYGSNFITLTDDEGNELELEHLDTLEWNGNTYMAFYPTVQEGEELSEEEEGIIILKAIEEDGEEILSTLESDEEIEAVLEQFEITLFEDEDDDSE